MDEVLQARIDDLRGEYDDLLEEVAMTEVTKELADTATEIAGLPGKVKQIRDAGYAYANYLESKVETLDRQWAEVRHKVEGTIRTEFSRVQSEVAQLDAAWDQLEMAISGATGSSPSSSSSGGLTSMLRAAAEGTDQEQSSGGGLLGGLNRAAAEMPKKRPSAGLAGALSAAGAGAADAAQDQHIETLADQVDRAMKEVQQAMRNAQSRVRATYGKVPENVSQTMSQIRDIETYLERAESATFEWLAGEDVFMVVKAEWKKTGKKKDDPDGFFYITNQRILMEQSEKKGGFMGFGGKRAEDLMWEAPIGSIADVSFEKKGMFGGIDLIHIQFGSGGPFGDVTIEVKDGLHAKVFASKLRQATKGDIERERGLEQTDKALVEAIADLPTTCPVCGATFDQEITRGMTQLECAYCGSIVRIGAS